MNIKGGTLQKKKKSIFGHFIYCVFLKKSEKKTPAGWMR